MSHGFSTATVASRNSSVACRKIIAAFHSSARQPEAEAERVVVAAVAPQRERRAAELARPDHQRLVEQAQVLEVLEQPGDWLIDLERHLVVAVLEVAVLVPGVRAVAAADVVCQAGQLHEPDPPLDQPAREQALPGVGRLDRVRGVEPVQPASSPPTRPRRSTNSGTADCIR